MKLEKIQVIADNPKHFYDDELYTIDQQINEIDYIHENKQLSNYIKTQRKLERIQVIADNPKHIYDVKLYTEINKSLK